MNVNGNQTWGNMRLRRQSGGISSVVDWRNNTSTKAVITCTTSVEHIPIFVHEDTDNAILTNSITKNSSNV